jgi:hypothetical protein
MRFEIEASLTYDFPAPYAVLLLVEAARGHGQSVSAEALTFWPPTPATRIDDADTGERRTVFTAAGRMNTESLVRVATGRDAADIAFMTIFGSAALVEQHFRIDRMDG